MSSMWTALACTAPASLPRNRFLQRQSRRNAAHLELSCGLIENRNLYSHYFIHFHAFTKDALKIWRKQLECPCHASDFRNGNALSIVMQSIHGSQQGYSTAPIRFEASTKYVLSFKAFAIFPRKKEHGTVLYEIATSSSTWARSGPYVTEQRSEHIHKWLS